MLVTLLSTLPQASITERWQPVGWCPSKYAKSGTRQSQGHDKERKACFFWWGHFFARVLTCFLIAIFEPYPSFHVHVEKTSLIFFFFGKENHSIRGHTPRAHAPRLVQNNGFMCNQKVSKKKGARDNLGLVAPKGLPRLQSGLSLLVSWEVFFWASTKERKSISQVEFVPFELLLISKFELELYISSSGSRG